MIQAPGRIPAGNCGDLVKEYSRKSENRAEIDWTGCCRFEAAGCQGRQGALRMDRVALRAEIRQFLPV
ncbi:MAG: hypothetical protein ACK5DR_18850, partial [Planctomyces sp.]